MTATQAETEVQWQASDFVLESFLRRYGIRWSRRIVRLEEIELGQPGRLSAGSRQVDEDTVVRYAVAMAEGAEFPPLCLVGNEIKGKKGKPYRIGQGRHRLEAAMRLGERKAECYIAFPETPEQEWALLVFYNQTNGVPLSHAEALEQAMETLRRFPDLAVDAVAAQLGLKTKTLRNRLRAEKARETLRAYGLRKVDGLRVGVLDSLGVLQSSAPAMVEAAKLAIGCSMTEKETRDLVKAVKAQTSDHERLRVIDEHRGMSATPGAKGDPPLPRNKTLPRDKMGKAMDGLYRLTVMYPDTKALCITTPHLHKEMAARWRTVRAAVDESLEVQS